MSARSQLLLQTNNCMTTTNGSLLRRRPSSITVQGAANISTTASSLPPARIIRTNTLLIAAESRHSIKEDVSLDTPDNLQKSQAVTSYSNCTTSIVQKSSPPPQVANINFPSSPCFEVKELDGDFSRCEARFPDEFQDSPKRCASSPTIKGQQNLNNRCSSSPSNLPAIVGGMKQSWNQSLCDEEMLQYIRIKASQFSVETAFLSQVESTFKSMEERISNIESQFEISFSLSSKLEAKYSELHSLIRGTSVYKVSRRNKKSAQLRIFSYVPGLDAFSWRSPKELFPHEKQLMNIKDIREVKTQLPDVSRRLPAKFMESQYLRFVMMDKHAQDIEIICEDPKIRNVLQRLFISLVEDIRKSKKNLPACQGEENDQLAEMLVDRHAKDVKSIREQMIDTRKIFAESTRELRAKFIESTSAIFVAERTKRRDKEKILANVQEQLDELAYQRNDEEILNQLEALSSDNTQLRSDIARTEQSIIAFINQTEAGNKQVVREIAHCIQAVCDTLPRQISSDVLARHKEFEHSPQAITRVLQDCLTEMLKQFCQQQERRQPPINNDRGSEREEETNSERLGNLLEEYTNIIDERSLLQQQLAASIQREEQTKKDSATKNAEITRNIEDILVSVLAKEDHFSCVVEGLQLMREELIEAVNQRSKSKIKGKNNIHLHMSAAAANNNTLKVAHLEGQIREKDIQIKHLANILSSQENKLPQQRCSTVSQASNSENVSPNILSQTDITHAVSAADFQKSQDHTCNSSQLKTSFSTILGGPPYSRARSSFATVSTIRKPSFTQSQF